MTDIVLATGGGAALPLSARTLKGNGTVIYLFAEPQTLWDRVCHSRHRPMLQAPISRARLFQLFAERDPLYREVADHVVPSERDAVLRIRSSLSSLGEQTSSASVKKVDVGVGERSYPDSCRRRVAARAPPICSAASFRAASSLLPMRQWRRIIWRRPRLASAHGTAVDVPSIPEGEAHKSWPTLQDIITRLLELRAERSTLLVAPGGGVVGDLAGFAAAIYLRGMPFCRCRRCFWPRSTHPLAARPASITRLARTWSVLSGSRAPCRSDIDCLATLPPR